jgi:L-ascorbate metabolism protein UlaG (beta-lactamase superfamily)
MTLMQEIRKSLVPNSGVGMWWLGQAGFIFKSPAGQLLAIDPYLTNSHKEEAASAGFNVDRIFPSPISPEELDVDAIVLTHSHADHCDPATVTRYRSAGGRGPFLVPGETMDKLLALGVPREEVVLTWPNKQHRFGDLMLKTTFAIPYWGDDVTHTGALVFIDNGPKIYFTGDTDYHDILGYIADYKPHVMVTVINGAFRNMGPNEATKLTAKISPEIVIPYHYGLFPDNTLDPRLFRTTLHAAGLSHKLRLLEPGREFMFHVDGDQ